MISCRTCAALMVAMTNVVPATAQAHVSASAIVKMDITQLRAALDSGDVHAVDVTRAYVSEIDRNNKRGRALNAVTSLNPDALSQARAWDDAHARGEPSANMPLGGIPFLAKDNYDTKGLVTSGGSIALATSKPAKNASVIDRLLTSGAILLGKTNMSELAASYGWLGYSSYGGQTVNPFIRYAIRRVPAADRLQQSRHISRPLRSAPTRAVRSARPPARRGLSACVRRSG